MLLCEVAYSGSLLCARCRQPYECVGPFACLLLQALTSKDVISHRKAAMPADVAKALGRISSGLYIVTAAQDNATR